MTTTTDHTREHWFHEAGGDHCPHGAEPDSDSDAWDDWDERHTGSPQDVRICLDAPADDACLECSEDDNEMVPWAACHVRDHRRPAQGMAPNPGAEHQQVTVWVGALDCLERECDEYFTDDGETAPGVESCSHIREEAACSCQRQAGGEYTGSCPAAEPATP